MSHMQDQGSDTPGSPEDQAAAMRDLSAAGVQCTRCPLHETGYPVVWGEGDPSARVMFVGQGPGERESADRRPFVGPAGQLLDRALAEAGIDRRRLWLTNALKHWATAINERGTVVNREPRVAELRACAIWLDGELAIVRPRIIVCVGGPAARAVAGRRERLADLRGAWFDGPHGAATTVIYHPSYLLRLRAADPAAFPPAWRQLLDDLSAVRTRAEGLGQPD